jgi:HlyD family secretion protein
MWRAHRRLIVSLSIGILVLLAMGFALRSRNGHARYATAVVDRGTITESVGATGALEAVTTVQVGSQVSGSIQSLSADFNSRVRKGQVVARLDPSIFDARLGQARANLVAARANTDRAGAEVEDARQKLQRAQELAAQNLLPQSDLDSAKAAYDSATAQVKAAQAAVTQAQANVSQAELDLAHTVITAPIDGVVIARNIDVGQTVAASFQAPTLFVIANDLSQMQVNASVDEADIGHVRTGQDVTFRVDAYPERTFAGRVQQVRLQPTTVQNVVTYNAIVTVQNPKQLLMPGMTATVSIIVNDRDNALRLPAAALRFRPEGASGERQRAAGSSNRATGAGAPGPADQAQARPSGTSPSQGAQRSSDSGERGPRPRGPAAPSPDPGSSPRTRRAEVYVPGPSGTPEPRSVSLGITDGQYVEVVGGLQEGELVITGTDGVSSVASRSASPSANNPFAPRRPEPRQR